MPSDESLHDQGEHEEDGQATVHRLHPLSLVFRVFAAVRTIVVPAVLVLFASGNLEDIQWLYLVVGPSLVYAIFHYVTNRYRFAGDEMVVQGGVVFRFERHIPYERVQNIDLSQNPFHRLFRVADVKIETASGSEAEAHLQVLSLDAVDAMRRRVFAGRGSAAIAGAPGASDPDGDDVPVTAGSYGPVPEVESHEVMRLGPRELVMFGLISNRGMAVVLAALGLAWELDLLKDVEVGVEDLQLSGEEGLPSAWLLALGALTAVVLLRALSIGWAFWKLHGFSLRRAGDDLQTSCGLFTRLTATIPRGRIQAVTVTATLLHRLCGRVAVKVDTAGGSSLEESAATRSWVAPLLRRDAVDALLREVQPELELEAVAWEPVDDRAVRRLTRRRSVFLALLAAVGCWTWTTWCTAALPVAIVLAWLEARARIGVMGWVLGERAFLVRHGLWTRRIRAVRYPKIQVVSCHESPFDRRWGTVSLGVDTAGTQESTHIDFVTRTVGEELADTLAARIGTTVFRW